MPFEDAKTYRFNPFDLTKVWPHGDYPLQEVGRMMLNRNFTDHHAQIEQAALSRATSWRAPACGRTRCCWPEASPTPMRIEPGSV